MKQKRIGSQGGFTLLELVLATVISALVVGMLATVLSFSLRVWEKQQNQKTSDMPALLELLKWQLANFDPTPLATGEGHQMQALFVGDEHSLAFATDHSVRALSKGAPVIARYLYSQNEKKLYYAERPLDPYHPDEMKEFLAMKPGDDKAWPRFFPTDAAEFTLDLIRGENEGAGDVPSAIAIRWSPGEGVGSTLQVVVPNFLFQAHKKAAGHLRPGGLPNPDNP